MTAVPPITGTETLTQLIRQLPAAAPHAVENGNFASLLSEGIKSLETKVARADEMVKSFALDDGIPVHQVTYALEEARLAVELAMQVRSRLLEGYRDLMNMQL
jgi:flagellar hook-basal body complex protein FliE